MKPNLILIALFSLILQQTSWASQFHPQEFCHLFEPETDQNMCPSLTATPISVSQSTCVKRFALYLEDLKKWSLHYIYIEVQFDPFPDPSPKFSMLLLEGDNFPIMIYSDNNKTISKDVTNDDYDAYINHKTFHRIPLRIDSLVSQDTKFRDVAVYKLFEDPSLYHNNSHVVSYTIKVRVESAATEFICLNNCSGHGRCDDRLGQCICHAGFFDSDCNVKAVHLDSGVSKSQSVPPKSSAYYYTSYQNQNDVFTFSFKMDQPGWNVAVQFNSPNDFLINSRDAFQWTNPSPLSVFETSQEFNSTATPALRAYLGGEILVFITNPTESPMNSTVQVDIPVKGNKNILLIIAIATGGMLLLFVLVAFLTKKCRRARATNVEREEDIEQRANSEEESVYFRKAEIEKYFPLKNFLILKLAFYNQDVRFVWKNLLPTPSVTNCIANIFSMLIVSNLGLRYNQIVPIVKVR